jgi:CheY-like chemotaxis protein
VPSRRQRSGKDIAPRLLVVGDEPELTAVERFGGQLGFEVGRCRSGAQALARGPEIRPDFVIADLQTPKVGDLAGLRAIHRTDPDCGS